MSIVVEEEISDHHIAQIKQKVLHVMLKVECYWTVIMIIQVMIQMTIKKKETQKKNKTMFGLFYTSSNIFHCFISFCSPHLAPRSRSASDVVAH